MEDIKKAISWIKQHKLSECENCLRKDTDYCSGNCKAEKEILKISISAMEELQQYRQLCEPEEIEHMKTLKRIIKGHGTIGKALDACAEYEKIGTPEECREARERQQAKKPTYDGDGYAPDGSFVWDEWLCPHCKSRFEVDYEQYDFCPRCGQAIGWKEENDDKRRDDTKHER